MTKIKIEAAARLVAASDAQIKKAVGVSMSALKGSKGVKVFQLDFKDYKKAIANLTSAFGEPEKNPENYSWLVDDMFVDLTRQASAMRPPLLNIQKAKPSK